MTTIDRMLGLTGNVAIKAPCRVVTTANVALNGLSTVDGIALASGDRVLVRGQTNAVNNGIYKADTGDWTRDVDFNGNRDSLNGTIGIIAEGANYAGLMWRLVTPNPIVIGTSALLFDFQLPGVYEFGAVGDGVTDDGAAIQAAINAAAAAGSDGLVLCVGKFYTTTTINIKGGVTLDGGSFLPGNPVAGSRIIGAAFLTPVVQMGTTNINSTQGLKNISVTRVAGTPDAASVGILIEDGYNVQLENFMADNHGICVKCRSHPSTGAGLSIKVVNGYTSRAVAAHVVNDSFAELYWIGGRLGMNGAGDYSASTYLRCQGGVASTAGGPNTINFIGVQFNQGTNVPTHFWEFVNCTNVTMVDLGLFRLTDCHIESVTSAFFYSDATWTQIHRLDITNCSFYKDSVPMWALNAATQPLKWNLIGNNFFCSTFNLAPTANFGSVYISGGIISGSVSLAGASGSTVTMAGVSFYNGLTVSGGPWGALQISKCTILSGSFVKTATGAVLYDGHFAEGDWEPLLLIDGSATGINQTFFHGHWMTNGRICTLSFNILLSSKGIATGNVTISGMPFQDVNDNMGSSGGGAVAYYEDMFGVTGAITVGTGGGTSVLQLFVTNVSTTDIAPLTDGFLTDTTALRGTVSYFIR